MRLLRRSAVLVIVAPVVLPILWAAREGEIQAVAAEGTAEPPSAAGPTDAQVWERAGTVPAALAGERPPEDAAATDSAPSITRPRVSTATARAAPGAPAPPTATSTWSRSGRGSDNAASDPSRSRDLDDIPPRISERHERGPAPVRHRPRLPGLAVAAGRRRRARRHGRGRRRHRARHGAGDGPEGRPAPRSAGRNSSTRRNAAPWPGGRDLAPRGGRIPDSAKHPGGVRVRADRRDPGRGRWWRPCGTATPVPAVG